MNRPLASSPVLLGSSRGRGVFQTFGAGIDVRILSGEGSPRRILERWPPRKEAVSFGGAERREEILIRRSVRVVYPRLVATGMTL